MKNNTFLQMTLLGSLVDLTFAINFSTIASNVVGESGESGESFTGRGPQRPISPSAEHATTQCGPLSNRRAEIKMITNNRLLRRKKHCINILFSQDDINHIYKFQI